jgi:hypothetical protein
MKYLSPSSITGGGGLSIKPPDDDSLARVETTIVVEVAKTSTDNCSISVSLLVFTNNK